MDRQKDEVGNSDFELPDVPVRSPQGSAVALHWTFFGAPVPSASFLAEISVRSPQDKILFSLYYKKNLDQSIKKKEKETTFAS